MRASLALTLNPTLAHQEKSKGHTAKEEACDRISPWEMEPDVVEERRAQRERLTREQREAAQHQTARLHQAASAHAALADQVRAP